MHLSASNLCCWHAMQTVATGAVSTVAGGAGLITKVCHLHMQHCSCTCFVSEKLSTTPVHQLRNAVACLSRLSLFCAWHTHRTGSCGGCYKLQHVPPTERMVCEAIC